MELVERFTLCTIGERDVSFLYVTDDKGGLGLASGFQDDLKFSGLIYFKKEADNVDELLNAIKLSEEDENVFVVPLMTNPLSVIPLILASQRDVMLLFSALKVLYFEIKEKVNERL